MEGGGWAGGMRSIVSAETVVNDLSRRHNPPPRPAQPARSHCRGHRRERRLNITYLRNIIITCSVSSVHVIMKHCASNAGVARRGNIR